MAEKEASLYFCYSNIVLSPNFSLSAEVISCPDGSQLIVFINVD